MIVYFGLSMHLLIIYEVDHLLICLLAIPEVTKPLVHILNI